MSAVTTVEARRKLVDHKIESHTRHKYSSVGKPQTKRILRYNVHRCCRCCCKTTKTANFIWKSTIFVFWNRCSCRLWGRPNSPRSRKLPGSLLRLLCSAQLPSLWKPIVVCRSLGCCGYLTLLREVVTLGAVSVGFLSALAPPYTPA